MSEQLSPGSEGAEWQEPKTGTSKLPSKYEGLPSAVVEELWTPPTYIDAGKDRAVQEQRDQALAELRSQEAESQSLETLTPLQEQALFAIADYLQGGKQIETQLTAEEKGLLDKMRPIYEQAKATSPDVPVAFQFSQPEDEELYAQIFARLSKDSQAVPEARSAGNEAVPQLSLEEKRNLHGWNASYELAKTAKDQGVDLSTLSREEYAKFAIQNSLAIDGKQLRVAPWQRMTTSVEELIIARKLERSKITTEADASFTKFCFEIKQKAGEKNLLLQEGVTVRRGTKDVDSWLFFGINNSLVENRGETFKSYISVKDLNTLTPERFTQFMVSLKDANYNGDIKIFQDLTGMGVDLNDQIVMHGASRADAELGLSVAEKFFGDDLDQKSYGRDETIDGKEYSYSEVLAMDIANAINPPKTES